MSDQITIVDETVDGHYLGGDDVQYRVYASTRGELTSVAIQWFDFDFEASQFFDTVFHETREAADAAAEAYVQKRINDLVTQEVTVTNTIVNGNVLTRDELLTRVAYQRLPERIQQAILPQAEPPTASENRYEILDTYNVSHDSSVVQENCHDWDYETDAMQALREHLGISTEAWKGLNWALPVNITVKELVDAHHGDGEGAYVYLVQKAVERSTQAEQKLDQCLHYLGLRRTDKVSSIHVEDLESSGTLNERDRIESLGQDLDLDMTTWEILSTGWEGDIQSLVRAAWAAA